jgi:hypothetical protein
MASSAVGYSGTPLWRKLGLAAGQRLVIRMAPPAFDELIADAPADLTRLARLADFDISIQFVTARAELDRSLELLLPHLRPHGVIWIAARDRRRGAPRPYRGSRRPNRVEADGRHADVRNPSLIQ